jgi:hypothetical protein
MPAQNEGSAKKWQFEWWELVLIAFFGIEIGISIAYSIVDPDEYLHLWRCGMALGNCPEGLTI